MKISAPNNTSPNFRGISAGSILSKAAGINSWQQRAALGVAAITLQPAIDLANKDVDEKTRKVSANRSFAKGLIGAATGIVVRGGCMKAVEFALKNDKLSSKLARITADDKTREAIRKSKDFITKGGGAKQYAGVIGTVAALGVMLVTNFLIDAPLTNWLTNKLNKKYEDTPENKGQPPVQNNTVPCAEGGAI